MASEIKTCPFCDGPAGTSHKRIGDRDFYLVCCEFDDCAGSYEMGREGENGYVSLNFAIDEWNRRA